jgi:hypothetical protein
MIVSQICLIRETSILTDALVQAIVPALQTQIDRDFYPVWNLRADVSFVPPGQMIPGGACQAILVDTSPDVGALGFHDTTDDGWPIAYVAVGDCLRDGLSWPVTVSHEILEMICDPEITKTVIVNGEEFAFEVADSPEDDSYAYPVLGHHVTAFVFPSWFDPNGQAPYSYPPIPEINKPFALAPGGYIGVRPVGGTWSQRFADAIPGPRAGHKAPSSRTMRRFSRG